MRLKSTHCKYGHEWTSENTYLFQGGLSRQCRECRGNRYVRKGPHPRVLKSHCQRNHPFSNENTYWTNQGQRGCKACRNIRAAKHYAKKLYQVVAQ